jgi:hypothetical protein
MNTCNACTAFLKNSNIDLKRSFTKIENKLHLGFNRPIVCPTIAQYVPDTIIFAGNGAVELSDGGDCWQILRDELRAEGLLGGQDYQEDLDALTWLTAQNDFFSKTVNPEYALEHIGSIKKRVISALNKYKTLPREIYCSACNIKSKVPLSKEILILTTNWDLGLFKTFPNVIQLHGRCDYAEQAVLPLQNISSLMAKDVQEFDKLNCGILPGPFLQQCLENTRHLIFWGTGLNDYDAALWHFMRGFLKSNVKNVQLGIAAKDQEGFRKGKKRVERFFPSIAIQNCLCHMLTKSGPEKEKKGLLPDAALT